jgi:hypothetical protein
MKRWSSSAAICATLLLLALLFALRIHASKNGAPAASLSDASPACEGADGFDFWIGDWRIEQRLLQEDGEWLALPARTSVRRALGGCALIEHWHGDVRFFWEGMREPQSMEGLSVRAFDPRTGEWSIHWMDTRSPRFERPYVGRIAEGSGEFFREWDSAQGRRKGRIAFSNPDPRRVEWSLAVSSDDGRTWTTLWTMTMHRADTRNPIELPRTGFTHPASYKTGS